ncbi:flavin reductase family protein [Novosphingobium colocasiae]|uniref:flavin reductase family protein n=1 Tax=Novosphingobium colocasiae TaxID=1256513 RepID=UPI0035B16459
MAAQIPDPITRHTGFSDLPIHRTRSILANRPVVLMTTRHGASDNVMPIGCLRVPEGSSARISCVVAATTQTFAMLLATGECAINVPPRSMAEVVSGIGACSGALYDKFALFGLARAEAGLVNVPVLPQCIAQLECRVSDDRAARRYGLFMLEVVRLRVQLASVTNRPGPTRPARALPVRTAPDCIAPVPPYSSSSMSQ